MAFTHTWKVIGHAAGCEKLVGDLDASNIPHAYLFSGPANIGKSAVAFEFAQMLQCEKNGCGECKTCMDIEHGIHADTLFLRDDGGALKIETVRTILEKLYTTTEANYKILVIENVERVTTEAANALLKTLEDPPGKVMFLLTSSQVHEVLPTIISRVRTVAFHQLPDQAVRDFILKYAPLLDENVVNDLVFFAQGRAGVALDLLKDIEEKAMVDKKKNDAPTKLALLKALYEPMVQIIEGRDYLQAFGMIEEFLENEGEVKKFLDLLLLALQQKLRTVLAKDRAALVKTIDTAHKAYVLTKNNVNSRLLLENLMLSL